tara:strand:+ start:31 stop:756 length:726 start_codon:yes stop_codon:yes gene_type:complete
MTTDRIISKVQKLLALARNNSNGNEAEAAAQMAERLMRKHALSTADVELSALLADDPLVDQEVEVSSSSWRIKLAWVLGEHCRVSVARDRRNVGLSADRRRWRYRVYAVAYGHASDVEVWRYLLTVAERQVNREAAAWKSRMGGLPSRSQMTRFRAGAVQGLAAKLREQRRQAAGGDSDSTAMVLQSRADRARSHMESLNERLGTYKGGTGGNRAGYKAGQEMSLRAGVKGSSGPARTMLA